MRGDLTRYRRKAFQDTGNAVHSSTLQEVEQEREVAFEVETVREVQKPVHYSPLTFRGLHRDASPLQTLVDLLQILQVMSISSWLFGAPTWAKIMGLGAKRQLPSYTFLQNLRGL
jgi:hypothetical protein